MIIDYYKKTWHRVILEKLLKQYSHLLTGSVLDVGSKNRRYDYLIPGQVTAIDKYPNEDLDILETDFNQKTSFPDESFDNLLSLEVFEYLDNLNHPLTEVYRLLKPDGQALISIPFMYHSHEDNIRYTKEFIYSQANQFSQVEIINIGNAYIVIWDIVRKKLFGSKRSLIKKIIFLFLLPFLIILKIFRVDKITDQYYSGLFIKLKK